MLIRFDKVTKEYPQKTLFREISFAVHEKERIGLIGLNGSGKTSLIRLITGDDKEYDGVIEKPGSVSVGCLYQEMYAEDDLTLYDAVMQAFPEVLRLKRAMGELEPDIHKPEVHEKYGQLQSRFELLNGYNLDNEIEKVLYGLSFTKDDLKRSIQTFSGGEKRRAGLAYLLLLKPDLLVLDEPTNHLDIPSVRWLEGFLLNWQGAILLISHDRYFLNKIVNRVFEIENNMVSFYKGNYEEHLAQKELRREVQRKEYEKQQELIGKTEEFIRRNIEGQKTKQAKSRRKMLEKMTRIAPVHNIERNILIRNWNVPQSYEHVVHLKGLSKSYDGKVLYSGIDMDIYRGEKIALIGANGTGKTTLLKTVAGKIQPDTGLCKIGEKVNHFYFSQELELIKGNLNVMDFIHKQIPMSTELEVRNLLAWFYFRGDEVLTTVDKLSGGEKSRLMVLSLLLASSNFLLLDEPTNHLDIYTRESFAEALSDYPGTVLFVSHDRYFIDSVADRLFVLSGTNLIPFDGTFAENEEEILALFNKQENPSSDNGSTEPKKTDTQKKKNVNVYKVSQIEDEIALLESRLSALEKEKFKEENYTDGRKMKELDEHLKSVKEEIDKKYAEWEEYQS